MAEREPVNTSWEGRELEGILRTEFGRRRSAAVDKAMKQLRGESLHNTAPIIQRADVSVALTLLSLLRRWFPVGVTIALVVTSTLLIAFWRSSQIEKDRFAKTLSEAKQYAKSQALDKLVDAAFGALDAEDLEKAEKALDEILELHPTSPDANFGLGEVRRRQDRLSEAEQLFLTAIKLKADYAAPYNGLALVFEKNGKIDEAEQNYRKAIRLDSVEAAAYINLADLLDKSGRDLAEAEQLYQKAIELEPTDTHAIRGLARLRLKEGQRAEAESLLRKALAENPTHAALHNDLPAC